RKLKENAGLDYTDCPGRHVLRLMATLVAEDPKHGSNAAASGSGRWAALDPHPDAACACHPRLEIESEPTEHTVAQ
ncbi:MAG: hypothetical protein AAF581_02470, partial [Planctomycetota bacterium]